MPLFHDYHRLKSYWLCVLSDLCGDNYPYNPARPMKFEDHFIGVNPV